MQIDTVTLNNFRNYRETVISFHPDVNILIGGNAQGKTNILEAIFYAATGKSHRTNYDQELISWGEKVFRVIVNGKRASGKIKIEIYVRADGKKVLKVNNQTQKRISDLIGAVNVVLFSPEDMLLIKGGPSVRRKFLDIEISQTSPFYCHNLVNYNRVISQRNNLLKAIREQREGPGLLEVWDTQMVEYGTYIIQKRREVLKKFAPLAWDIHRKITQGREDLQLSYLPSVDVRKRAPETEPADYFLGILRDNRQAEITKGVSLFGPHRDDIDIKIGHTSVKAFGSQGQQRTCALSMKLAEVEFIKAETGEYPVLLLDDVMSELDADRRRFLLEVVKEKIQTFVTTTDMEEIYRSIKKNGRVFEVNSGNIITIQEG